MYFLGYLCKVWTIGMDDNGEIKRSHLILKSAMYLREQHKFYHQKECITYALLCM